MKKTLKNLIPLDHNIKIYVPGTIDVNNIEDNNKYVDKTLEKLSLFFGGSTSYSAIGCWNSLTEGLIKERVIICESYCKEDKLNEFIENIIEYCEQLKGDLSQEAISLEVDNKLYFV